MHYLREMQNVRDAETDGAKQDVPDCSKPDGCELDAGESTPGPEGLSPSGNTGFSPHLREGLCPQGE